MMAKRILFITTDQQRYDTLGCNGGSYARTPVLDSLAASGINFERAHPQSVVCMPSRATMITGQTPSTHGVWMNGVALPVDAPSVVEELKRAGFSTSLIGKAHFEPYVDPFSAFPETRMATQGRHSEDDLWFDGTIGPHRGFDYLATAAHGAIGPLHYSRWLLEHHPEAIGMFYPTLDSHLEVNAMGGGETGAVQAFTNEVPREWYHTDWVASQTMEWLSSRTDDEDWFCWMSFPDPHHPWDPPASELGRVPWQDLDLPEGYLADPEVRRAVLDAKPRHWSQWYDGSLVSNFEAPLEWVPATLEADQLREITAKNAVEVELIDEAIGRVLAMLEARGWDEDLDIIFTTDHGELGGDFGLLFKGPYHVDGLLRLPLLWRPAPSSGVTPARVSAPVGLINVAPTFAKLAGLDQPDWMEGASLPISDEDAQARGFERVLTEWDSELFGVDVHLRTIYRDGLLCTRYLPGTSHDGTEGELYVMSEDPLQQVNRFDDPSLKGVRDDLLDDMVRHEKPMRTPRLDVVAPV
jgi:arylsulfatase A-like enzyme